MRLYKRPIWWLRQHELFNGFTNWYANRMFRRGGKWSD